MSDRVFSFSAKAKSPQVAIKVTEVLGAINEDKSRFAVTDGPTRKGSQVTATLTYVIPSGRGNTDDVKRKVFGALKRAELLEQVEYTVTLVRPEKPAKAEKVAKEAQPAKARGKAAKAAPAPVEAEVAAEDTPAAPVDEAPGEAPEVQGAEG